MKTFEELINEFVIYAKKSKEPIDYSNKESVKEHNKYIDGYRRIAKEINRDYNDKLELFAKLLNDNLVGVSCAICIIELFDNNQNYINPCKKTIKKYIDNSDNKMDKIGFELYLKNLEKKSI